MCVEGTDRYAVDAIAHAKDDTLKIDSIVVGSTHPMLIDAEHVVAVDLWTGGEPRERVGLEFDVRSARRLAESLIDLADKLDPL